MSSRGALRFGIFQSLSCQTDQELKTTVTTRLNRIEEKEGDINLPPAALLAFLSCVDPSSSHMHAGFEE
jgi:hypothetical protein